MPRRAYNTDVTTSGDTKSFLSSTSSSWIHPVLLMLQCSRTGFNGVTPDSTAQVKSYLFDSSGLISHPQITQIWPQKRFSFNIWGFSVLYAAVLFPWDLHPYPGQVLLLGLQQLWLSLFKAQGMKSKAVHIHGYAPLPGTDFPSPNMPWTESCCFQGFGSYLDKFTGRAFRKNVTVCLFCHIFP